jgi:WD40 repeat protein
LVDGGPRYPEWFREDFRALLELLRADKIHPVVAERLPLSAARRAHELLESPASAGKLVLTGHTDNVEAVAPAQLDGRPVLISGGDDDTVRVWDPATGKPVGSPFTGHTDDVLAVATAQLGGLLVAELW